MTARELIAELEKFSPQAEVIVWDAKRGRFSAELSLAESHLTNELLVTPLGRCHSLPECGRERVRDSSWLTVAH